MMRSGSTLMEHILASHSAVYGMGEDSGAGVGTTPVVMPCLHH
jgi:hypothetical protein